MTKPLPLTAIILTKDEAINIEPCLNGLKTVDDVVVVDSGSSDNTLELAQNCRTDIRIFHHPFKDFGDQRNWALDHADPKHKWVLFIDADEYCTEPFLIELQNFINNPSDHVGAYIAGKYFFLGKWIRRSTMYPSFQLRLLKHGHVRYKKAGHGQCEIMSGTAHYFKEGWIHNGLSKGIHQWVERHNNYSSEEATYLNQNLGKKTEFLSLLSSEPIKRRRALKKFYSKLPAKPLLRFLFIYIIKAGFLDGRAGLIYCSLVLVNSILISAKMAEIAIENE